MDNFGSRLRTKRLERGWTQEQLGEKVGVKKSAVAKYENGRILNVTTEVAERFAEALGISVHDLLGSFERNLYALDFTVGENSEGMWVSSNTEYRPAFFTHTEWALLKEKGDLAAVQQAVEIANKKSPDTLLDIEGLSEDKRLLVKRILSLSDDEVRSLRAIVDQVLALRGQ